MTDFSELAALAQQFAAAGGNADKVVRKELAAAGRRVAAKAAAAAPKDRPWLSQNIKVKHWRAAGDSHTDVFVPPDPLGRPVAVFVEYGTTHQAPQPFLTPHAEGEGEAMRQAIARALEVLGE